ncbi:MAG TPA: hypothetical protein VIN59_08765, partial [Alphaproteobacteria bacterium]
DQGFHLEVTKSRRSVDVPVAGATVDPDLEDEDTSYDESEEAIEASDAEEEGDPEQPQSNESGFEERVRQDGGRRRGRRGGRGRNNGRERGPRNDRGGNEANGNVIPSNGGDEIDDNIGNRMPGNEQGDFNGNRENRDEREGGRRRRGRRGGRGRNNREDRGPREDRGQDRSEPNGNVASAREAVPAMQPVSRPARAEPREQEAPRNRDYETVNEVTGERKKGWWKKLTG